VKNNNIEAMQLERERRDLSFMVLEFKKEHAALKRERLHLESMNQELQIVSNIMDKKSKHHLDTSWIQKFLKVRQKTFRNQKTDLVGPCQMEQGMSKMIINEKTDSQKMKQRSIWKAEEKIQANNFALQIDRLLFKHNIS
jgi:chorismate mutase